MSTFPRSETLLLDEIKPYWRNPRKISEDAISKVAASLTEFGYLQPIVVDLNNVIIIGHTRYTAMRRLGLNKVEVLKIDLPPLRVKELRVIDNRTHELSWWDNEKLHEELYGLGDDPLIGQLFPEAPEPTDSGGYVPPEDDEGDGGPTQVEFICPACLYEWITEVTREQVLSGRIVTPKDKIISAEANA